MAMANELVVLGMPNEPTDPPLKFLEPLDPLGMLSFVWVDVGVSDPRPA
jgi:hypothetical protein